MPLPDVDPNILNCFAAFSLEISLIFVVTDQVLCGEAVRRRPVNYLQTVLSRRFPLSLCSLPHFVAALFERYSYGGQSLFDCGMRVDIAITGHYTKHEPSIRLTRATFAFPNSVQLVLPPRDLADVDIVKPRIRVQ